MEGRTYGAFQFSHEFFQLGFEFESDTVKCEFTTFLLGWVASWEKAL